MSNQKIKSLLQKLHDEINDTAVDDETRALLRTLEADIDDLLESTVTQRETSSVVEIANKLEASFAATHPVAERVIREILDTFARMGL